ncbi:LysR substrate-binding domain-containing protein [Celerinatantimonas sp. MCCC 1A17872]|uniref:LysR family transcriptional regulator n=1 Tax=Celerinatantimonas sp. MCCC 1A17872 TaxID=3177514 RepID=UPI0038CA737D
MDRIELMQIYLDINDIGSLAGVARQRNIAPSAVTQALQQLEHLVGTNLIVRTTRRMSFTPEGEQFLEHCRFIVDEFENAIDHLNQQGPLRGTIRLTTTNDFGRMRLPGLIDAFLEQHPQVKVELHLSDGLVDLVAERFDFAIRTGPLVDSRFKARLLASQRRLVCASPRYWQKWGKPVHPRDLKEHNCLVLARPHSPQSEWHFVDGNRSFTVKVSGNRVANDGGALRQWAIRGAGVVLKSQIDVHDDLKAERLQSVLSEYTDKPINIYAVYPALHRPPRRVSALIDFITTHINIELA